jgi:hypothetical protein
MVGSRRIESVLAGLAAAAAYVALVARALDRPGLEYDELHQAVGAFAYVGARREYLSPVTAFSLGPRDLPIFNLPYTTGIKTLLYGLYLRWAHASFSVVSWRLVGIGMVAIGLFAACALARRAWLVRGLALFLALFLLDPTVLLATRHDWGPVAFALLLRLVFIATWLRGLVTPPRARSSGVLGACVGLAVLEKLSSLVLLAPLAVALAGRARRSLGHWAAAAAGLAVGLVPLIALNVFSWKWSGRAISLHPEFSARQSIDFHFAQYLGLGGGQWVNAFILGRGYLGAPPEPSELVPLCSMLALVLIMALRRRRDPRLRLAAAMALAYAAVGLGLYALPHATWSHHWILGTPFQYCAIALAVAAAAPGLLDRILRLGLLAFAACLLICRSLVVLEIDRAVARGESAVWWDPALTEVGRFAARHADEAAFVAAEWGIGTQMYCLANGRARTVYDFSLRYSGPRELDYVIQKSRKNVLYIVHQRCPGVTDTAVVMRIVDEMRHLPGWKEVPVEDDAPRVRLAIRKFVRL